MEILRVRQDYGPKSTTGTFSIEGTDFNIVALEDKDRGLTQDMPLKQIETIKVQNQTAIPKGRYEVTISYSNRFKCDMPEILNVPGFAGIRIHWGNDDLETDGCILLGLAKTGDDFIISSKAAFNQFFPLLKKAVAKEKVFITIK